MSARRVWLGMGLLLTALVALAGFNFYRQLASLATHMVGPPEHTYPVTTFPPEGQPVLRLAVVGDVGTASRDEYETAAAMLDVAQRDWYDALLLLGDNAYPDGDPSLLTGTVFKPFGPLLVQGARLFAVLGNHDVLAPDGGSEMMSELGMDGKWWSAELGDVLLVGLDSNQPDNAAQLRWLDDTLATSRSRWRIVILHHSLYSAGYQGSTTEVRNAFTPLFELYGVQLVLSGHEHDYERSVPIKGVTYLVSGAGAEFRRTGTEGFTAYSAATFHFLDINVFDDRIYVQAIDNDGRRFDEVTILP